MSKLFRVTNGQGRILGEFGTRLEMDDYITSLYPDGIWDQGTLDEVVVEAPRRTTKPAKTHNLLFDKVSNWFNDEVLLNKDNIRVRNYLKAEARNPNFSNDWNMASNIAEGANVMSGGFLNRLSPTQNIGLVIDAVLGDNVMQSWFGNSGITSDNFALNHPLLSAGINLVGDVGLGIGTNIAANRGVNYLNNHPDLVAKIRHPTYKKYYHGTSADYDLKDARIATSNDIGFHASDNPAIAEAMKYRGEGTNPHIIEFYGPKPSTETIDIVSNDVRLLSKNYPFYLTGVTNPEGYVLNQHSAAGDMSYLFKLLKSKGANPKMLDSGYGFTLDKSVNLNLRKTSFPKIPESLYPRIDALIEKSRLIKSEPRYSGTEKELRTINAEAAKILNDNGYKVVKYNNTNSFEGGGGASYFFTDPSVLYLPKQIKNFKLPWFLGNSNEKD